MIGLVHGAALGISLIGVGTVQKVLMVLGGAAVGGFGVGLLAQLLARVLTGQRIPRWPLRIVRVLAAVAAGWLVALYVSGPGGWGWGPGGGAGGLGSGGPGQDEPKPAPAVHPRETARGSARLDEEGGRLTIEVVGASEVRQQFGEKGVQEQRFFRLRDEDDLLSPDELKRAISKRKDKDPKLRVLQFVSLAQDSPHRTSGLMGSLETWAKDQNLTVYQS